jgi:tetratricopeptide (TPR) repeat protein
MAEKSSKKQIFFLVLAVVFVYFNSLPNDFIFDDVPLVQNSLWITSGNFADILRSYRPLRYISYSLDYRIFGMNPAGFRLMNIIYHTVSVLALFWALRMFGLTKRAAFAAALIFAVHPVNTDAVAYISGRRDVLMGLFYILSIGCFFKFYRTVSPAERAVSGNVKKQWGMLILALVFMVLSISSKEMGATIPLVFIMYAGYKDGAALLKKPWFYFLAMIFLILFSFFAFLAISGGGSALVSLNGISFHGNSPEVHYLTAATIFLHYLKLTIFPWKLILDNAGYPLVLDWNFEVFFSILSMFVLVFLVWSLLTTSRKNKTNSTAERLEMRHSVAFWIVFFIVSLAPVLQIIPLHEIVAVHYLYVPVTGFCAIAGTLFDYFAGTENTGFQQMFNFSENRKRAVAALCITLLFALFSLRTISRNFEMENVWKVLHADAEKQPLSFRGLFTIGAEYLNMKFPDKAWEYYQKSIDTGYWDPNLLGNVIGYHIVKGDHEKAISFYEEMVKKGEYITSNGTLNIAYIYMIRGDCDTALKLVNTVAPDASELARYNSLKKCRDYGFEKFDESNIYDVYAKQKLMKELEINVERKPYLKKLIESGEFEGDKLIELVADLAAVDLVSDIPEAIKYYKYEIELYAKAGKPAPEVALRSVVMLEDYSHKVLDEGKYLPLEF